MISLHSLFSCRTLGASQLLDRESLQGEPKPLGRETYAGCVDSAGGHVLANVLPLIKVGHVLPRTRNYQCDCTLYVTNSNS